MITEQQWLTADDPAALDLYRTAKGRHRKWRLFAAACCRRAMSLAPDPRFDLLSDAVERFADGEVTWDELKKVRRSLQAVWKELGDEFGPDEAKRRVHDALDRVSGKTPLTALGADSEAASAFAAVSRPDFDTGLKWAEREQVALAHDVFGNPFRPVAFDTPWRSPTAVSVARTMYESRDFAAMPVLADALEEAGCDHPDVLSHCRNPQQVHVRGCWVIDIVLGKE